ncbi:hypothetical protein DFP73DRAFT_635915 [Morchella snyderi]|nr:hypothetical protein DFP73DRAFT_635915 [Morchella snyderi]
MSQTQRLNLASDLLGQMNKNHDLLGRLISREIYNMMSADERRDALLQLRVNAEVLWRVADLGRVEAITAQSAAAT